MALQVQENAQAAREECMYAADGPLRVCKICPVSGPCPLVLDARIVCGEAHLWLCRIWLQPTSSETFAPGSSSWGTGQCTVQWLVQMGAATASTKLPDW